jgi:hypothetical protein
VKRIKLRKIKLDGNELEWAEILRQVVQRPLDPQRGVDIDEMRKSIRLLDIIDASNGVLELEDSDWEYLKSKTVAMQWAVIDRNIVKLVDEVVLATEEPAL